MTEPFPIFQPHAEPGVATAEDGVVLLDGPNGMALTLTPYAAAQTGRNLIAAAEIAQRQNGSSGSRDDV
ncbi:hypothetical protein NUH86_17780 [Sphingobium sp. JS3065]|uniref:hypothetical protein n=1 Tax=Sphingobium sp. JS3065 TaxID=2970925 RepID=UPI002264E2BB|nr:hypothetical protein [Sphingobium sp. JS3065]UZW57437.1 hypothetical protein NUH86_17780 [Sphingobium sp. JS3065]